VIDRPSSVSSAIDPYSPIHSDPILSLLFFFNDTATTEIYTLSLHDALPISRRRSRGSSCACARSAPRCGPCPRSEEHTSELQSHSDLVCRLLLGTKKDRSEVQRDSDLGERHVWCVAQPVAL